MSERSLSGSCEIEHTADWALRVWAPDLAGLLEEAARGMISLMELELDVSKRMQEKVNLSAPDAESLMVAFLGELLYIIEKERTGFDQIQITLHGLSIDARLSGGHILAQRKEIKAVTFHQLDIGQTDSGLETVIVFDV